MPDYRLARCCLFALALISACPLSHAAAKAKRQPVNAPRIEIPIERMVLLDGVVRYWVPVTIGTLGPVPALLDTGSTGLLVLSRSVKKGTFRRQGWVNYSYANGETLSGYLARAPVKVGSASTGVAVSFGVIEKVKCTADKPKCLGAKLKPQDYGIGGDGIEGEGFQAILGIGPDQHALANPLAFMGDKRWIIDLPLPGMASAGTLIVNPTEAELVSYALFPPSPAARKFRNGFKGAVDGCLVEHFTGTSICGPVAPDTGGPSVDVKMANPPNFSMPWNLAQFALEFGTGTGKFALPFDLKPESAAWVYFDHEAKSAQPLILAGVLPYLKCLVLYDYRTNSFGFKPR